MLIHHLRSSPSSTTAGFGHHHLNCPPCAPLYRCDRPHKRQPFCAGEQAVRASQRGCLGEGVPRAQVVSAQVPPGRGCFHPVSLASPVQVASSLQLQSRQSCQNMPATLNLSLCIQASSEPVLSDISACTVPLWCGVCSALKLACLSGRGHFSNVFSYGVWHRQHACLACGQAGEFVLRRKTSSHAVHLICRRQVAPTSPIPALGTAKTCRQSRTDAS